MNLIDIAASLGNEKVWQALGVEGAVKMRVTVKRPLGEAEEKEVTVWNIESIESGLMRECCIWPDETFKVSLGGLSVEDTRVTWEELEVQDEAVISITVTPAAEKLKLEILEARYGWWIGEAWAPRLFNPQNAKTNGFKDVTETVASLVEGDELHISSSIRYPLGYTLWEETAWYPPYPRRLAIRYRYGSDGKVHALLTEPSKDEIVKVSITRDGSEPKATRSFSDDSHELKVQRALAEAATSGVTDMGQNPARQTGMAMGGNPAGPMQKQVASPFAYNHDLACGF